MLVKFVDALIAINRIFILVYHLSAVWLQLRQNFQFHCMQRNKLHLHGGLKAEKIQ